MSFPRATVFVCSAVLLFARSSWEKDVQRFRDAYEADLKAPGGWLEVTGLIWLNNGVNKAPGGKVRLQAGRVTFEPASGPPILMRSDKPGPPTVVNSAGVALTLIERGGKLGLRIKDPNSPARRNFTGTKWFPIDRKWVLRAKWVAYATPKKISILNIVGMTDAEPSPGYTEFALAGKTMRLEPITEGDHLFFVFKDQTAGKTTYGAGRFLYAPMPLNAVVVLDFNEAENPPCAFTAYATCPLPPKQNILPIAIEAGEKQYGNH